MKLNYLKAEGRRFLWKGREILLRGWALGSWMNFEHFMIGLPGTDSQIRGAFQEVYGSERAEIWLDRMLECMVGEADLVYLKSLGINSIRIPFSYTHLMDDRHPEAFREKGFERLDRVIQLCGKHELFVILDLHAAPGSQNPDWHSDNLNGQALFWKYRVFQDQTVRIWQELAARYAENPWVAGYDIINEPGYGISSADINDFYSRIIQAIREKDPNHILFLEGTDFGRDFTLLEKQSDPNIAYTVHFYPFVLEEDILDPAMNTVKRRDIYTRIFDRQLAAVTRLERPVWCGESGYEIPDEQEAFRASLLMENISLCESRGISWNLWTYKDARCMGIVVPQKDSDWMRLAGEIGKKWSHHREEKISGILTREMGSRFYAPLAESLAYDLDFQVRAVLHEIAVEQVLKPMLRQIPWEQMKHYPESFSFDRCDRREQVTEQVRAFIAERNRS